MKWVVDRIEDEIAILENIETKEKQEVFINSLPSSIHEGSILLWENNTYRDDLSEEIKRRTEILAKFKKLRSNPD